MDRGVSFKRVIILISFTISMGTPINDTHSYKKDIKVNKRENYALQIVALKKEMVSLQERVTHLEKEFDSSSSENGLTADRIGGKTDSKTDSNHVLKKREVLRRRIRRPEVAFQASLTKRSAAFKLFDTIIFNNVITNIGHAYNKHTGFFTAPVAGTYTFNTNIVSEIGHYVEASIKVNDMVTVSAISDHRIPQVGDYFTTWDQGNAVAILRLKRGDKVTVSVQWPQGNHVIHGVGKSSFSGYLLRSHERR